MPLKTIQKRSAPEIKDLREIRDGKNKAKVFCEGLKILKELVELSLPIRKLFIEKSVESAVQNILGPQLAKSIMTMVLSSDVMSFASGTVSPPGVIAIVDRPGTLGPLKRAKGTLIVVVHDVQLPQNIGALLRTAEGAGVDQVWVTGSGVDPFNPKVIRASSGSCFRMPVRTGLTLEGALAELEALNVQYWAAIQGEGAQYYDVDWKQPSALILGSEGQGFTSAQLMSLKNIVSIPMSGRVESLNVGVAGAICLFEAKRQRLTNT